MNKDNQYWSYELLSVCQTLYSAVTDRDDDGDVDLPNSAWKIGIANAKIAQVRNNSENQIVQEKLNDALNNIYNAVFSSTDDSGTIDLYKSCFFLGNAYQIVEDTIPFFHEKPKQPTAAIIIDLQPDIEPDLPKTDIEYRDNG